MFFEKTKVLVIVSSNLIEIYAAKISVQTLSIPSNIISDLEILDRNSYGVLIKDFLEKLKLSQCEIIVVLKDDVLYFKKVPKESNQDPTLLVEKFKQYIPHQNFTIKSTEINNEIYIYGVNRDLYSILASKLQDTQNVIISVMPEGLVQEQMNAIKTDPAGISDLFRNPIIKTLNFL